MDPPFPRLVGKSFALNGVGMGVSIGVYGVFRGGKGEIVPFVPLLGSYDLYGRRLVLGVS